MYKIVSLRLCILYGRLHQCLPCALNVLIIVCLFFFKSDIKMACQIYYVTRALLYLKKMFGFNYYDDFSIYTTYWS